MKLYLWVELRVGDTENSLVMSTQDQVLVSIDYFMITLFY